MMMGGPMMRGPVYQPPPQLVKETAVIQEKKEAEAEKIKEDNNISEVTKNMVDVLSSSTNPKHRNCKFLKFLNKLNHGAYEIKDD